MGLRNVQMKVLIGFSCFTIGTNAVLFLTFRYHGNGILWPVEGRPCSTE